MIFTSNPLLNFTIKLIIILFMKILPIILIAYILYFIRKIYERKNVEYSYKIFDFDFNGFCIFSYFLGYFCLLLWIRISYFSQTTDLKLVIKIFKEKYIMSYYLDTLINIIFFFILLLCIIYFFKLLHKFFIKQIVKRFLILQVNFNFDLSSYTLFTLERKINNTLSKVIDFIFHTYSEKVINFIWRTSYKINHFIFTILPTLALYIFFIYEILFNNFVITPNFYKYLLFYFLYYIYKNISIFIANTDIGLNYILYRMYYKEKSIMYVNIPKEYQHVILRYIQLGLHRNMKKNPEPLLDNVLGEFCYYMSHNCEFHLTKNGEYCNNEFSFIDTTNKTDTIIYPYHYTIKFYRTIYKLLYGKNHAEL